MQEQHLQDARAFELVLPVERARIINLCAYLTGSRAAAEDLAQEAMLAAWQNRHKLVDASGYSKWLSVVTRNICLRWMRQQGRRAKFSAASEQAQADLESLPTPGPDLEIELERDELAELLDRALAQLPAETRTALIQRYILELPQAEVAARLGLSEGAVEARLHRGKLNLHRLLATDLRAEADAYGLVSSETGAWQETRIWCPICGQRKLHGTLPRDGRQFELHCPACSWDPKAFFAQSSSMAELQGVKGYKATLRRFMTYMSRYLGAGLVAGQITCRTCGHTVPLRYEIPPYAIAYPGLGRRGVSVLCPFCGSSSYGDIYGLALDAPQALKFWQENPRIRTLPERELEAGGRAALLIRFESLSHAAGLDVILDRENYVLLEAHTNS